MKSRELLVDIGNIKTLPKLWVHALFHDQPIGVLDAPCRRTPGQKVLLGDKLRLSIPSGDYVRVASYPTTCVINILECSNGDNFRRIPFRPGFLAEMLDQVWTKS